MTKKTITGAGSCEGASAEEIVNSALEMLSVRAWPGPERNNRIEEFIMEQANAGRRGLTRKKLWLGGLMLLLAGSAIGAVTTRLATYRFTGEAVDQDGNRYAVEGEMQIEEQGDEKTVSISMDGVPDVPLQSGELVLEDGRRLQMVPVEGGGASITTTVAADGSLDLNQTAEAIKKAKEQKAQEEKAREQKEQAKPEQPK